MDVLRRFIGSDRELFFKEEGGDQDRFLLAEDGGDTSDSGDRSGPPLRLKQRPQWPAMCWMLSTVMLGLYSVLLTLYVTKRPSDLACAKQLSLWSPLNDAIEYEDISVENGFAHQTKYRGPPNPELEEAWEDLWNVGSVQFPADKLAEVNKSAELPDGRTLLSLDDGENYVAQFEVFHQLHCLNTIRQYTWRDWYLRHRDIVETPPSLLGSIVGARMHADHCIEALRIALSCHGDTTPFFTVRDPDAPLGAQADFTPQRRCRSLSQLREWVIENRVNDPSEGDRVNADGQGHH